MGIDPSQYATLLARTAKQNPAPKSRDDIREAELHQQILDECKRREWVAFHSRTDKRATISTGTPDFVIVTNLHASGGSRVLFVECKVGSRKLSMEQLIVKTQIERLGHRYHVVRSFEEFMEVVG